MEKQKKLTKVEMDKVLELYEKCADLGEEVRGKFGDSVVAEFTERANEALDDIDLLEALMADLKKKLGE